MEDNERLALRTLQDASQKPNEEDPLPAAWILASVVAILIVGIGVYFSLVPCSWYEIRTKVELRGHGIDMVCGEKEGRCHCETPDMENVKCSGELCVAIEGREPSCVPWVSNAASCAPPCPL